MEQLLSFQRAQPCAREIEMLPERGLSTDQALAFSLEALTTARKLTDRPLEASA